MIKRLFLLTCFLSRFDKDSTVITNYHGFDESIKAILKASDNTMFEINSIILSEENKMLKNYYDYRKIGEQRISLIEIKN